MESIFDKVKDRVTIQEVVERIGNLNLNHSGKTQCPFHKEKTPSFSIKKEENIFKCFGCGESGDAIHFVAKLKQIEPLDAAKLIAETFNISYEESSSKPIDAKRVIKEIVPHQRGGKVMSPTEITIDEKIKTLAKQLVDLRKNIILIYAFNCTGKTRLSVEYKNITKEQNDGKHAGVYYNAYSEDLFVWDNDTQNEGLPIKLNIVYSSLNQYHSSLDEDKLREKLYAYKPKFDFKFIFYKDTSKGIESISFYPLSKNMEDANTIKISRGEQQIFIWCLFLTMFDIQGWTNEQNGHFFIDDPVSSLDDHNIFVTASTLMDLIDEHHDNRKIIITTHHVGFFSILCDWLSKGEKADTYKKNTQKYILKSTPTELKLLNCNKDVFLYHLELLQILQHSINDKKLYAYHFAVLRQVLENISSFLGVGRISYVLEKIGIDDTEDVIRIVNTLSHKNVFKYEAKEMVPDNERLLLEVFDKIQNKYNFVIHVKEKESV